LFPCGRDNPTKSAPGSDVVIVLEMRPAEDLLVFAASTTRFDAPQQTEARAASMRRDRDGRSEFLTA
jgi:hypothetical protein